MKARKRFETIRNSRAYYEYEVLDRFEAGVVLTGPETKSVRLGRVQLGESRVMVREGSVWLLNCVIMPYEFARQEEYDPGRTRALLLHAREIDRLIGMVERKGVTLIPLSIYQKHGKFKVEVGVVRGKKEYEKREQKKRADIKREVEREVKAKYRG